MGYNLQNKRRQNNGFFALFGAKVWVPFVHDEEFELEDCCLKRRWQDPWAFEVMEKLVSGKTLAEWEEWLADKEYSIRPFQQKQRQSNE